MRAEDRARIQQEEQLQEAQKAWAESEWRLLFLRTISAQEPKEPTDDELLEWHRKNQQF